jgi:hypothetical protein
MTTESTIAPARHQGELLGQTVVLIGSSSGIGLETARRARPRFPLQRRTSRPSA